MCGALVCAAVLGTGSEVAFATGPAVERIPTQDTFVDDVLSPACGFTVMTTASGFRIERAVTQEGTWVVFLTTVDIGLTATANGTTVRFRDVGADLVRREPDGTLVLAIIGQVPFDFTGILELDPLTGEIVQEPQHRTADHVAKVCTARSA